MYINVYSFNQTMVSHSFVSLKVYYTVCLGIHIVKILLALYHQKSKAANDF